MKETTKSSGLIARVKDIYRQLTYQGRHVAPPDPEMVVLHRRIKILAIIMITALLLVTLHLACLMLSGNTTTYNDKIQPVSSTINFTMPSPRETFASQHGAALAMPSETVQLRYDQDFMELMLSGWYTAAEISHTTLSDSVITLGEESMAATVSTPVPTPVLADYELALPLYLREMLAQVLYKEADCVISDAERSMVVWVPLNRYDSGIAWFGGDLESIITKPWQFAYDPDAPVTERNLALVNDVVGRWYREKQGETNVGRTLPINIWFFEADEEELWHNNFYYMEDGLGGERHYFDYNYPLADPYSQVG